jgi:uroporphyrinogen-III synthase
MTIDDTCEPLVGFRIAVTSAHRADELTALLRRHGAEVTSAAALQFIAIPDDNELHRKTQTLINSAPDILIATTSIGVRAWIAATDGWGLTPHLIESLQYSYVVARGPKTSGALRSIGLADDWSTAGESSQTLIDHVVKRGIRGKRIAVQVPGTGEITAPHPELLDRLRDGGAQVVPLQSYRWTSPPPGASFDDLIHDIADAEFEAITFTSAPAVTSTLHRADQLGVHAELISALMTSVHPFCVGPMAAQPLTSLGVPVSVPEETRLGAMARVIVDELPLLQPTTLWAAGHHLDIRGTCVLVDGQPKAIPPAGMSILRVLAQGRGNVVPRVQLLAALPGNSTDTHAVDAAVMRLRTALGDRRIIATVIKRGYRLAIT